MHTFFGFAFTVPQNHVVLIERLGRYHATRTAGLSFKVPILDKIRRVDLDWADTANKEAVFIELSEQQTDTPARQCQTKDNVTLAHVDASVYWRIKKAQQALYKVDHLPRSVHDTALNALRSEIGRATLDELLGQRDQISRSIATQLAPTMEKWGVELTRVDIQEIVYDEQTADAMRQQMEAERSARAEVLRSTGSAEARITLASSERDAGVIRAEGEAKAMEIRATAESAFLGALAPVVGPEAAVQLLLAQKVIAGYAEISKNPADKVYLPASFHGLLSAGSSNQEWTSVPS
ncbi:MAG: SPFH/Band 7/PHB domain protein [Planctomycetota bacterium]|nr:SPFH/Band 7/PHB domain protein [Planctomycetota bacterium]